MDRKAVNSLLVKLGMADPEKLPEDRAVNRITIKVKKSGLPADLTSEEKAVVTELGLGGASVNEAAPAETKPKTAPAVEPETEKEEVEGGGTDDSTPVTHRLKGINGNPDRVQVITPKAAASRNRKRAEDKACKAFWEMDASIDPAKVPPEGMSIPSTETKPKTVGKTNKTKTPNQETAVAKKNEKPAKGGKGVKSTVDKKETKTVPPAKGKVPMANENAPKKKRESAGAEKFRALLEDGTERKKADVLEKLIAAGVKPGTANSYIVWAKRPIANPVKNPFGFRIEETKNAKGDKILQRVAKKK